MGEGGGVYVSLCVLSVSELTTFRGRDRTPFSITTPIYYYKYYSVEQAVSRRTGGILRIIVFAS